MWSNNFYNISFLLLCFIATSSEYALANVLCPGKPSADYCDCTGDCTEQPNFCECEEAQACCEKNEFLSLNPSDGGDGTVLCPNLPALKYCDCEGDCTEKPQWCQCEEAQACCEKNGFLSLTPSDGGDGPIPGSILCPDQPKENFCDCDGDCTEKPDWCQCAEAQECCEKNGYQTPSSHFVEAVIVNSENILCPGQQDSNYCDCEGDCTANPDFCACEEAQECCADATPVVFCPDQPKENYCDCTGDCIEKPEWCQCEKAQACCEGVTPAPTDEVLCPNYCDCSEDCRASDERCACDEGIACCAEFASKLDNSFYGTISECWASYDGNWIPIALGATGLLVLIWFLKCRNKKESRQGAFVSEAATKAMLPPAFSSNSDEEETIASTARPDE